jgi:hypothetical protein
MSLHVRVCARKLSWTIFTRVCCMAVLCAVAVPLAAGQVTVINPQQLDLPVQTAQVLLRLSCKVAAEQFHVAGETEFPLTVVVGEENEEHYIADDVNRVYTVYLKRWNESRFTTATMMIAVRRLALPAQKKMITEVLERAHAITPIRAQQLNKEKTARGE